VPDPIAFHTIDVYLLANLQCNHGIQWIPIGCRILDQRKLLVYVPRISFTDIVFPQPIAGHAIDVDVPNAVNVNFVIYVVMAIEASQHFPPASMRIYFFEERSNSFPTEKCKFG
jgi:hypothetical protein